MQGLPGTVTQHSIVDEAEHAEADAAGSVLDGLTLRQAEAGPHFDDRLCYLLPQVRLGGTCEGAEHHSADLFRQECLRRVLMLHLDQRLVDGPCSDLEWPVLHVRMRFSTGVHTPRIRLAAMAAVRRPWIPYQPDLHV